MMRVSLFHNRKAGDRTPLADVQQLIEVSGHEVVRTFDREAALGELAGDVDLIVAAGGDGTVAAAARLLAGRSIPLAILPTGTANNVCRRLYGDCSNEQLIDGWRTAARRSVDLGVVRGPWGERRFLEGVGVGLVPAVIESVKLEPLCADDAASEIVAALVRYRAILGALSPQPWTVTLDDQRVNDRFLLIEVLNIGSVGPNIVLCPDADPSDGYFCVVTAREEDRSALLRYVQDRLDGRPGTLYLPTTRARHVEIHGPLIEHVDDEVFGSSDPGTISIGIEPSAVEFLA